MKALLIIILQAAVFSSVEGYAQTSRDEGWNGLSEAEEEITSYKKAKLVWERRYMSNDHVSDDIAADITFEPNTGAIYVTGHSYNSTSGLDIVTIKYDSSGQELWTARFDGPGHGNDFASAVRVDASGNVIVSGHYWSGLSLDYVTIKYNGDGAQQWTRSFDNGLLKSEDTTIDLAIDGHGNIYVVGVAGKLYRKREHVLIVYDTEGREQRLERFGDPVSAGTFIGMAQDSAGAVHIATVKGDSTYAFKYDQAGERQKIGSCAGRARWLRINRIGVPYILMASDRTCSFRIIEFGKDGASYQRVCSSKANAVDFAVGTDGSSYVLGSANNGYLTLKYDSVGAEEWAAIYEHPNSDSEGSARSLAVDDSGNVYVTGLTAGHDSLGSSGTNYTTIKYDRNGEQQWVEHFLAMSHTLISWYYFIEPIRLKLDAHGNPHLVATMRFRVCDYVTIKYDQDGKIMWQARYNGPGSGIDLVQDLKVDRAGNVYVLGNSYLTGGLGEGIYRSVVIKYDSKGTELWRNYLEPEGDCLQNFATSIVIDQAGNSYVLRNNHTRPLGSAYLIDKYDAAGMHKWRALNATRWAGIARAAVDKQGSVYLAAETNLSNIVTIKHDSLGNVLWRAPFASASSAPSMVCDDSGNVYVNGVSSNSNQYVTIKYDGSGQEKWHALFSALGLRLSDGPNAIAVLPSEVGGGVCFAGLGAHNASRAITTVCYNAVGVKKWDAIVEFDHKERPPSLGCDNAGNVFVTVGRYGYYYGTTFKLDTSGKKVWQTDFGGNHIAVDKTGNIYVAGSKVVTYNSYDFRTVKYSPNGELEWDAFYNSSDYFKDDLTALALDETENVYVAGRGGFTYHAFGTRPEQRAIFNCFVTIKYRQTNPVFVDEHKAERATSYRLAQNHPNPFNPSTTIRYALTRAGRVSLKIYNLAGQEVATLVEGDIAAGEHEIKWTPANLASGVYLYRLHAGDFVETKKLVLLQ